ncbi:MAG: AAA family ATPase [Betaproteobacteria bacterium]
MNQIKTGIDCIDAQLLGGITPETLTLIYGEPETGKSTIALQCAVNCALQNRKVLFVDCDNTFSAKRLSQVAGDRFDEVSDRIILVKPKDFREQTAFIDCIQEYTANVGLIIVDTFTSLYGAQVAEASGKAFMINRELNRQLAILAQTVKTKKIPVLITSQVRSILNDQNPSVRPVATRVLKFWADNIIAIKPTEDHRVLKAILEKPHEDETEKVCYVQIGESGIKDTQFH